MADLGVMATANSGGRPIPGTAPPLATLRGPIIPFQLLYAAESSVFLRRPASDGRSHLKSGSGSACLAFYPGTGPAVAQATSSASWLNSERRRPVFGVLRRLMHAGCIDHQRAIMVVVREKHRCVRPGGISPPPPPPPPPHPRPRPRQ